MDRGQEPATARASVWEEFGISGGLFEGDVGGLVPLARLTICSRVGVLMETYSHATSRPPHCGKGSLESVSPLRHQDMARRRAGTRVSCVEGPA